MAETKSPAKKRACNFRIQYQQLTQGLVFVQISLELGLVELCAVEGAEFRRRAPECSDEAELQIDHFGDETELRLLRKVEAGLGFALHLDERFSRRDKQTI